MRRRFGRGRNTKRAGEGRAAAPIDGAGAFARIAELGVVGPATLTPVSEPGVPDSFAALATGAADGSSRLAVGFSPASGGDALLATLALAERLVDEESFRGEAIAVSPQWSIAARRRLALVGDAAYAFRAVVASPLGDGAIAVDPEPRAEPPVVPADRVGALLEDPAERDLFGRALAAFEGLAAKHGGAVRGFGASVELCLVAQCVAALRVENGGLVLATLAPDRSIARLDAGGLATAMDRLEGALRKRLADRRVRESDEGLRAQLAPRLAAAAGLRHTQLWPLGGAEAEILDVAGVDARGRLTVGAVRASMELPALGAILDAALAMRASLPLILGGSAPGGGAPQVLLAAREFEGSCLRALRALAVEHALFDVLASRGREPALERREAGAAPARPQSSVSRTRDPAARPRGPERPAPPPRGTQAPREPRRREEAAPPEAASGAEAPARRFDEVSLFDLDDDRSSSGSASESEGSRRRRRGRGRRRGRRGGGSGTAEGDRPQGRADDDGEPPSPRAQADRGGAAEAEPDDAGLDLELEAEDVDDLAEVLVPLAEEVPEIEEEPEPAPEDDDEEADEEEETDEAAERLRRLREARRRARQTASAEAPQPAAPRPPRRRAVFVAHADRDSVAAALLLARDHRLVESFRVYPQDDLMTFFRSVATDLREDTPIFLVGFRASPAHDALQAAQLYRDRIAWFDHHEWPPEDLEALRQAIGADNVHVFPGAGSALPTVLQERSRRSRFSDKLVDLVTGRFSDHDFERWGRLWLHRLSEIAEQRGDVRSRLDPLLAGRPSDLAREAAAAPTPPQPPEVAYVAERDFRLVHFGGHTLVPIATPPGIDPHLAARVARERYAASLSLSLVEGEEVVVLGTDDVRGRRSLDVGAMVEHLVAKHDWIDALPDSDHVARMRVRGLVGDAERLDDVVREIAMGRSILEG